MSHGTTDEVSFVVCIFWVRVRVRVSVRYFGKFRSLDILSVKKEARLSARALAEVKVGRDEEELRCNSLFIVCQRCLGLSEDEETRLE